MNFEPYTSYLVRFWQEAEEGGAEACWRGEIESIQTGQKWQFARPEKMFRFLQGGMEKTTRRERDTHGED